MGLADLHIHSIWSHDGTATISAILKYVTSNTKLNLIAITDHDKINGALEAVDLAPKYNIEVIPGSEISTRDGHLLALFINKAIAPGLSLSETVLRVGKQNGLCIAAHPSNGNSFSLKPETIIKARKDPDVARILIGVETVNSSLIIKRSFRIAEKLAFLQSMARVGNSDAHTLSLVGTAATIFPGTSSSDLKKALLNRETDIQYEVNQNAVKILSHWFRNYILRTAGWVSWNPHPSTPLVFGRLARIKASSGIIYGSPKSSGPATILE